jgi:hypothetical protein
MGIKQFAFNALDHFYIRLLGPFYVSAVFAAPLAAYFSAKVSKGYNFIWVTLAILGIAIYFQFKKIDSFFRKDSLIRSFTEKSAAIRWYFYFINLVGGSIFIYLLVYYYQGYNNPEGPKVTLSGYPILATIFYTAVSFIFGACAIGLLYSLLFLGPISNGVSLALTFHNWANGMGLDYQIFIQFLFDFNLPDILALIANLIWLTVSYNVTKNLDG